MGYYSSASAIPIVTMGEEISAIRGVRTSAWSSKCDEVRQALEEYGCFIVENDKIPADFGTKIISASEDLFNLPVETKKKNNYAAQLLPGYVGQHAQFPLYEAMRIPGTTLDAMQHVTDLMWPDQGNVDFCESIYSLSSSLEEISLLVARMVFESYNVSELFEACQEQTSHVIRMMKYKVPDSDETPLGLVPHVDGNFITVLYQSQTNGLEVETKSGEWVTADLSPSSFVFMAGEGLMAWSNGRINAARHKVNMANTVKTRYSFGIFTSIRWTETPKELVDEDHPLQFNSYNHDEYMRMREFSVKGLGAFTLKNYCGVN
ncbi:unnamed protein product [Rhodiola kirilowii]